VNQKQIEKIVEEISLFQCKYSIVRIFSSQMRPSYLPPHDPGVNTMSSRAMSPTCQIPHILSK